MTKIKDCQSYLSHNGYFVHPECSGCPDFINAMSYFTGPGEMAGIISKMTDMQRSSRPIAFADCGLVFDAQASCITSKNGFRAACTFYPGRYCAKRRMGDDYQPVVDRYD